MEQLILGLGFSGPDRSDRSGLGDRSDRFVLTEQRLVFGCGVFIPLSPLLRGLLVLGILLSFLKYFLDQLALLNTLCELC